MVLKLLLQTKPDIVIHNIIYEAIILLKIVHLLSSVENSRNITIRVIRFTHARNKKVCAIDLRQFIWGN